MSIPLRFTRSFYVRHAFIGGLLAFLCTVMVLMMKHAGLLVWFLPVVFHGTVAVSGAAGVSFVGAFDG